MIAACVFGLVAFGALLAVLIATSPTDREALVPESLCPRLASDYPALLEYSTGRRTSADVSQSEAQRLLRVFVTTDVADGVGPSIRGLAETVAQGVEDAQDGAIDSGDLDRYTTSYRELKEEAACDPE